MKAQLCQSLPRGEEWLYEIKFDGIRALAIKNGQSVSLVSRTGKSLAKFGDIADSIAKLPTKQAVLDGEIVAVDSRGLPSFQLLQTWHQPGAEKPPLLYYVFDALNLDGKSLISLPLQHRKTIVQSLLADGPDNVRFSAGLRADSAALMKEMQARGLEGLVAKLKDSKYEPGRRSGAWRKYKWTAEQEFVIGGYTAPKGGRAYFGAILVGYYEGKKLLFAGKVGTGFDEATLAMLARQFEPVESPQCPFANLPENIPGAYGRGITAGQMRLCTWLRPELVCQVRFSEWTRDHHLRQPVYLGLREDKDPQEVVREHT